MIAAMNQFKNDKFCTVTNVSVKFSDTFASKISAVNDKTADNSIGNVTGSNAVNVFLGIGIAWTLAAVYHAYHGIIFEVNPGTYVCVEFIWENNFKNLFFFFLPAIIVWHSHYLCS